MKVTVRTTVDTDIDVALPCYTLHKVNDQDFAIYKVYSEIKVIAIRLYGEGGFIQTDCTGNAFNDGFEISTGAKWLEALDKAANLIDKLKNEKND